MHAHTHLGPGQRLQVGESNGGPLGAKLPVPPQCTYTTPVAPAADVAAHSAAALALSAQVVGELLVAASNDTASAEDMLDTSKALYEYSKDKAGLQEIAPKPNATDTAPPKLGVRCCISGCRALLFRAKNAAFAQRLGTCFSFRDAMQYQNPSNPFSPASSACDMRHETRFVLQVSQVYPSNDDFHVRSHQLWAACTLWQATQLEEYWNETETIYKTYIRPELDPKTKKVPAGIRTQLYDPVANYYNPIWWALMCIAQSAPEYSGIVDNPNLIIPRKLATLNSTDPERQKLLDDLEDQEFARATRAEARDQIWQQMVLPLSLIHI